MKMSQIQQHIDDLISQVAQLLRNPSSNSSVSRLVAILEKLCSSIKGLKAEHIADAAWLEAIVSHLLAFLPHPDSKVTKKTVKALCEVEKHSPLCVKSQLSALKWTETDRMHLIIASSFLEWSETVRGLFRDPTLIESFLTNLVNELPSLCCPELWTVEQQQHLQIAIKVPLQLFQFSSDWFHQVAWASNAVVSSHAIHVVADLLSSFIYLLQKGVAPKDCVLLAGTALAFFLSLSEQQIESSQALTDVIKALEGNTTTTLNVGKLHITRDEKSEELGTLPENRTVKQTLGVLSFISGLLVSGKEELLCQPIADQSGETLLIMWLFPHLCDYCQSEYPYNAFHTFAIWFKKVTKLLPGLHAACSRTLFSYDSTIVGRTMAIVWTNLDSPVDGVHQCVMEVFDSMIQLNTQEHTYILESRASEKLDTDGEGDGIAGDGRGLGAILDRVLQMSWHIKGKYGLLASLLKYFNIRQFLQDHRSVFDHLLDSMSTNYLAPSGTELFRAIVQQIKAYDRKDDRLQIFTEFCLEPTITGLITTDSLLRHNVNHYWLPAVYKLIPESYELLTKHLAASSSEQSLHALIALHKTARSVKLLANLPIHDIEKAMCHPDEDVRLDAFLLVCVTVKKAEELSDAEMRLIERCLPYNMSIDSAPFRQQLTACLQNLLVRARDSSRNALRSSRTQTPPMVHKTIQFIDNLWNMCLNGLNPGANFQRLKSSLELINIILAAFSYEPERKQKKGNTPESVVHVVKVAHDEGKWSFYEEGSAVHILSCILHGTDEIRELTSQILQQYFPWPLPTGAGSPVNSTCQLLTSALTMCHSAKAAESEGGAQLVRLIYKKHVLEKDERFSMEETGEGRYIVSISDMDAAPPSFCMVRQLAHLLRTCSQQAHQNPLQAASNHPGHGLLKAIQYCTKEGAHSCLSNIDMWRTLVKEIVVTVTEMIKMALHTLGGRISDEDTAPSFEQMGLAIQETIQESLDGDGNTTDACLSSRHQLLMTWCWNNIREGMILLGEMVECFPLTVSGEGGILSRDDLRQISDIFILVLTKCRHRGAIEGCNVGFVRFCTKLLKSSHPEIHSVAVHILDQVLSQVSGTITNTASTTRRSAGLPLIIQSIVVSESKTKRSVLLARSISTLLAILQVPPPPDHDITRDLPHIHALNILKAIFRESSVSAACMPFIAQATMCTIEGFASPYWGIRNGAIQLFGTLVQRMLGQKKTKDDRLNTVTAAEFFAHYPSLTTFVLQHLYSAASSHHHLNFTLHPSLYPILTILAKLGVGIQDQDNNLDEFASVVSEVLGSPIMGVRELAAKALLPLIPQSRLAERLQTTVDLLPERPTAGLHHNHMHGSLLLIHNLLEQIRIRNVSLDLHVICESLCRKSWLCTDQNRCHVVRAAYLQVLLEAVCQNRAELPDSLSECLQEMLEDMLNLSSNETIRVGFEQFVRRLVLHWLESSGQDDLLGRIESVLGSQDVEVVLTGLQHLSDRLAQHNHYTDISTWSSIQVFLCKMVCEDRLSWQVLCDTLRLILNIHRQHGVFCTDQQTDALWVRLMALISQEENSCPASLSLAVSAILTLLHRENSLREKVDDWSALVLSSSDPFKAEGLRLCAATALRIAGATLVQNAAETQQVADITVTFRLFEAAQQLLMDDQPHIRQEAARFVNQLCTGPETSQSPSMSCIHSNVALEVLYSWICGKFASHEYFGNYMMSMMNSQKLLLSIVSEEIDKRTEDLFEPEEANAFREETHIYQLFCSAVKDHPPLFTDKSCSFEGPLKEGLSKWLVELENVTEVLDQHGKDVGPLNVSCSKHVYDALWAKLCLIERVHCHLVAKLSIRENLQKTLERLCLVSQLHPGLVGKARSILSYHVRIDDS